jgi:putative FmdB family regulatory protein
MPTYDYLCKKCDHAFEKLQRITEKPLTKCPKCGGRVERLIGGGAGLIFKGTGFYITDYKKSAAPKETGSKDSPKETKKKSDAS